MIKIEKIFEVESAYKAEEGIWNEPAQFTHLKNIDKSSLKLPFITLLTVILPLGLTTVGKRFKMTLEEME